MSDTIWQNEPLDSQCTQAVYLTDANGNPVTASGLGGLGTVTLKVKKPGGNFGTPGSGTALTEITGSAAGGGTFELLLASADRDTAGAVEVEISKSGAIQTQVVSFTIKPVDCLYYGLVTNVPDSTHIDMSGAVATDGYYAKSATSRVCIVRVVSGTGAGQCRLGINYLAANHRLQLDEAFAAAVDTTSVVRLEQCITAPELATDTRLANLTFLTAAPPTAATIASTILAASLGGGHTVQGALRRMDWINISKFTGGLSVLATFYQYDGTTIGVQATQDPVLGSRVAASTVAGD